MDNKVVVTGMGIMSCLGSSVEEFWGALKNGKSGIRQISQVDPNSFPCKVSGEIQDFIPRDWMNPKEAKRMGRFSQLAVAASKTAVDQSDFQSKVDPSRIGVLLGCGIGGLPETDQQAKVKESKGIKMTAEEESLFGIDKLNIKRSSIPAVTHVDYSSRIQTVYKETNPKYHKLITKFKEKTGCSVVVNTSFNVRGEPIVCSPEDAFKCFMGNELELLVIGNCILRKNEQYYLIDDCRSEYE